MSLFRRIPRTTSPPTSAEQSSVYDTFYGEMPMPATQFATTVTALTSLEYQPSVATAMSNASIVNRANRRNGMISTGGLQMREDRPPDPGQQVRSSEFQPYLIGPHVNYDQNSGWYIAYPAATVMFGGMHNLALSQRIPQLPTRTTGGPTAAQMASAPRFKAVQNVPRFSTMPPTYPTTSTSG